MLRVYFEFFFQNTIGFLIYSPQVNKTGNLFSLTGF